jgi:hypothetical protein
LTIRQKIGDAAAAVAGWFRAHSGETGVAFPETIWAKWGIKPYRADDLLKSKALRLETYREIMRDPVAKAAMYNRVFAAMTTEWDCRPAGYDRRKPLDAGDPNVQAAQFVRISLGQPKGRWAKLLYDLSRALVDGFAIIEKKYEVLETGPWAGKVGIARLAAKDVQDWDFECDEYMNVTGLKQQVQGVWYDRDRARFIVFSWLPAFENPLGQSEFRACYRAFWLKDTCFKFRAMYAEWVAKGRRKVTYPADQGAEGLAKATKLLELLENSIGMAIPSDLQVELIEQAVAPDAVFENFIGRCDKELVTGLEGAALQMLEGDKTGALRATETHRQTTQPWLRVFAIFLEAVIQDDLVADLVDANFAGAEAPEIYFRWTGEDLEPLSRTLKILQEMGLRIPAWYLYEQFDVPQPETEDEVLEPRPVANPFGLPGRGSDEVTKRRSDEVTKKTAAGAVELADPAGAADPIQEAIARAEARAPEAYRDLISAIKKKRLRRSAISSPT